jgi:hypothetical protein
MLDEQVREPRLSENTNRFRTQVTFWLLFLISIEIIKQKILNLSLIKLLFTLNKLIQ